MPWCENCEIGKFAACHPELEVGRIKAVFQSLADTENRVESANSLGAEPRTHHEDIGAIQSEWLWGEDKKNPTVRLVAEQPELIRCIGACLYAEMHLDCLNAFEEASREW